MDIKNLYVVVIRGDKQEKVKIEEYRKNDSTGHNEILITLDNQKTWFDAYDVLLHKDLGSVFCWKDYNEGKYIVLNESNPICPRCGWWVCHHCGACYCNKS